MDIGKQQRIIQVEPEPISVPVEAPLQPTFPDVSEPLVVPDFVPEEVPAGA